MNDGTAGITSSNRITITYDRCSIDRTLNGVDNIYYKINSEKAIKYMMYLGSNGIKTEPFVEFSIRQFGGDGTRFSIASSNIEFANEVHTNDIKSYRNNEYCSFMMNQIDRVARLCHTLASLGHTIETHTGVKGVEMLDTFGIGISKHNCEIRAVVYCKDRNQVSINDANSIADAAYEKGLAFTSLTNTLIGDRAYVLVGFVHKDTEDKKVAADHIKSSIVEELKDRVDIVETDEWI